MSEDLNWNMLAPDERAMIKQILDTDEQIAEFLTTCAERLRSGDNVYRIAHYLDETAANIRASHARMHEQVGGTLDDRPDDDPRYTRGAH